MATSPNLMYINDVTVTSS